MAVTAAEAGGPGVAGQVVAAQMLLGWLKARGWERLAAKIAAPLAIPGLIQQGGNIPIINYPVPGLTDVTQRGQITGEGRGAGISSWWSGVKLGAGNPFDVITNAMAQQLSEGVRQQGFRGTQADDVANASAELVKSLGIDYQEAIGLVTKNVRQGTMGMKDFLTQMKSLRTVAKETGVSVQNLVASFSSFTSQAVGIGGKSAQVPSTGFFQRVTQALPGLNKLNPEALGTWLTPEMSKRFTLMGGGNPLLPYSKAGLAAQRVGIQQAIDDFVSSKDPGMSWDDYAQELINTGRSNIYFAGLDATELAYVLKSGQQGRFLERANAVPRHSLPKQSAADHKTGGGAFGWIKKQITGKGITGSDLLGPISDKFSSATEAWAVPLFGDSQFPGVRKRKELEQIEEIRASATTFGVPKKETNLILAQLEAQVGKKGYSETFKKTIDAINFAESPGGRSYHQVEIFLVESKNFKTKIRMQDEAALRDAGVKIKRGSKDR